MANRAWRKTWGFWTPARQLRSTQLAVRAQGSLLFAAAPLGRTMLRHTRALLEEYRARGELTGKLPKRILLPIPEIRFTRQ